MPDQFLLWDLQDLNPRPLPHISFIVDRMHHALQPSGVIARVQAPLERGGGEVEHKIKGVKGEVDALLVDSRGLGQGLVEVKIGASQKKERVLGFLG